MKLFGSHSSGRFANGAAADSSERFTKESQQPVTPPDSEYDRFYRDEQPEQATYYEENEYDSPASTQPSKAQLPQTIDYDLIYKRNGKRRKSKKRKRRQRLIAIPVIAASLVCLYLVAMFSQIPFVKKWREVYIYTAMSTMTHQWLATAFIPKSVIDECMARRDAALMSAVGVESTDAPTVEPTQPSSGIETVPPETLDPQLQDKLDFYELFWELDEQSMEDYLDENPDLVANGYSHIVVNQSGLYESGIDVYTTMGEQVLAIDAENKLLLVRVKGDTFRGVLAIVKDSSMLHCFASAGIGSYGETVAKIAERNNGILAMTGSGFYDPGGNGNGGDLAGMCVCDGVTYGTQHRGWTSKRIELRENNRLYIVDAPTDIGNDVTDAVEFEPAMIINGQDMGSGNYYEMNPRACIGQSDKIEILMIVTEGRFVDSMGCSVSEISKILFKHNCTTAMNLDGGTSAIMWYKGEPITRCSNTSIPGGRSLPNAWVVVGNDE